MFIRLSCPECKENLLGANHSRIFFCPSCDVGYDFSKGSPGKYPVRYVEPEIKKMAAQVYFSFWRILSEYRLSTADETPGPVIRKIFYVPTFFVKNAHSFGDIGYRLTFSDVGLKATARKNLPVFPAERGLDDCFIYPSIYLQQFECRRKSIRKPVDVIIDHKDASLIMIPFYKINSDYQDSILSWKCPAGAPV